MKQADLSCIFLEMSEITEGGASSGAPLPPDQVVAYINRTYPGGLWSARLLRDKNPEAYRLLCAAQNLVPSATKVFCYASLTQAREGYPGWEAARDNHGLWKPWKVDSGGNPYSWFVDLMDMDVQDAWIKAIVAEFESSGAGGLALDNVGLGAGRHGDDYGDYEDAIYACIHVIRELVPDHIEIALNVNLDLHGHLIWFRLLSRYMGNRNVTLMFEGQRARMREWIAVDQCNRLLDSGLGIWIADRTDDPELLPMNWAWYRQYIHRDGQTRYGCEGPDSDGVKGAVTRHECYTFDKQTRKDLGGRKNENRLAKRARRTAIQR
jgi:hypothetical protein